MVGKTLGVRLSLPLLLEAGGEPLTLSTFKTVCAQLQKETDLFNLYPFLHS